MRGSSDSSCPYRSNSDGIQNAHFISAAKVAHCILADQTMPNLRNKGKIWNVIEDGENTFFGI